ncbi:MAG: NADH-quinone oxidoreductase subunit C [Candidatus Bathyarchaeia archaeon]
MRAVHLTDTPEALLEQVKGKFGDGVVEAGVRGPRSAAVKVKLEVFLEAAKYLKEQQNFEHVSSVSGVDFKKHLTVVYHLYSYSKGVLLEFSVDLPRDNPRLPSLTPLWGGANWHEREQYDFFGITFEGHPNLERIMTPPGWQYFPLRKEYRVSGELQTSA